MTAPSRLEKPVTQLAAAANVRAREQLPARRETRVVAGGAHDRLHRADDDARLSVEPLHEVIAAQRDDVSMVARESRELGLQRPPEPFLRPEESSGQISVLFEMSPGGDHHQRRVTQSSDPARERLTGPQVDAFDNGLE